MKRTVQTVAAFLACSLVQAHAIEGLRLSIVGSDVVLAWPSRTGETYIVQFRADLSTNCPWETLTNSLPAAGGTNWTAFIHAGMFQCASGGAATMVGGDGPQAVQAAQQFSLEDRAGRIAAAAEMWKARVAELAAEVWVRKNRLPFPWETGERPPFPWEAHLVELPAGERSRPLGSWMALRRHALASIAWCEMAFTFSE